MPRKKENKRNDGYYEVKAVVDHTFDGKPIYKSFYSSKSKTDARAKAEAYKLEQTQKLDEPSRIRFSDYADDFLGRIKNKVKSTSFANRYEVPFRLHLKPFFQNCLLHEIKKSDIDRYIAANQNRYAVQTLKTHISALSTMFNDAIDNHYATDNPCRKIIIKGLKTPERHVYTAEQADMVLEYCKGDIFGLHVHMLLSYGLSVSEYLGITQDDIDFDNLTISINKGVVRGVDPEHHIIVSDTKNKYRTRLIAITQESADMIRQRSSTYYISNTKTDNVLNPAAFRYRFEVFMKKMHKHFELKGIDMPILTPHELRHTRATLWVNDGKSLYAIAQMLGWSDLSMLRKTYGHSDIQDLRKQLGI